MRMKSAFLFFISIAGLWTLQCLGEEVMDKANYLREYVKKAHLDSLYSNESMSMAALFPDINGDGKTDPLVALLYDRDRDGFSWRSAWYKMQGISCPSGQVEFCLYCLPKEIYKVKHTGKPYRIAVLNAGFDEIYHDGSRDGRQRFIYDTAFLSLSTNGILTKASIPNGFDSLFAEPGFSGLSRIETEWYKGSEMERCDDLSEAVPPLVNFDADRNIEEAKIQDFVARYRKEVNIKLNSSGKLTVFVILLDADNDGDADLYVSSDAEKAGGSMYRWHLYLNDSGSFAKAKERVWFNRKGPGALVEILEPEEVAAKDAFHRVLLQKPFEPTVVILDAEEGRLHSHTVKNPLIAGDMKKRPRPKSNDDREGWDAREEWAGSFWKKHGFPPPFDFRELVADPWFFALERLPCREFAE